MDSIEVLDLLLNCGADVNLADDGKGTPLHDAANAGLVQNMQKLIEGGAEINKADAYEQTPLHMATVSNSRGFSKQRRLSTYETMMGRRHST